MTHEELQDAFRPYLPAVQKISRQLNTDRPEQIPSHLASGSDSHVFRLTNELVAKLPYQDDERGYDSHEILDSYVEAYIRGLGIAGLEQVVAFNQEDPAAVICEYIPGTPMDMLERKDRWLFTHRQYLGLFATLQAMSQNGLALDADSSNIIYHQDEGFSVIDYQYRPERGLSENITGFARHVLVHGHDRRGNEPLPGYALCFHDVCYEVFGNEIAEPVMEYLQGGEL